MLTFSLIVRPEHDAHVLQQYDEGDAPEDEGDGAQHVVVSGLKLCSWPHGMDSGRQALMINMHAHVPVYMSMPLFVGKIIPYR